MLRKIEVELSKRGIPCVWEQGGAYSNTGSAILVCNKYGESKKPIYIRTKGSLACGEHALIPIREGDYIAESSQHRGDFDIEIKEIKEINGNVATVDIINSFSENQWDKDLEEKFNKVVTTVKEKALSYHCRKPYFVEGEE